MSNPTLDTSNQSPSQPYTFVLGLFKDSVEETEYRRDQYAADVKQMVLIAWLALVTAVLFIVSDLALVTGRPDLTALFVVRLLWAAASIALLAAAHKLPQQKTMYRLATGFALVTVIAVILIEQSRPSAYISHFALDLLLLLGLYLAFPLPMGQRTLVCLWFSAGSIALLFIAKEPAHDLTRGTIILDLVIANGLGFLAARWNEISRRITYSHIKNEQATGEKFEEAIKIANQLSLLLPVCGKCKKVRGDDGYWHQMEAFLAEHSPAMFSHSLCSDCIKKLYPDAKI